MLTNEQRAAYERDGVIVVPNVFSAAEIDELSAGPARQCERMRGLIRPRLTTFVVLVLVGLAGLVSSEPFVPAIAGDTARLKTNKHPSKARIHFLLRLTAFINP